MNKHNSLFILFLNLNQIKLITILSGLKVKMLGKPINWQTEHLISKPILTVADIHCNFETETHI